MHRHHRRVVRKAKAAGVEVVAVRSPAQLDAFAALYDQTMQRLDAAHFYRYPDDYWQQLVRGLSEQLILFEAWRHGELLAGIVCLAGGPWFHYHLGATSDAARELGASHLLLYEAACHAQREGFSQFHLGSGVGEGGGSLLEFKQRFTHVPAIEQWLGKAVHDVDRYLELTGTQAVTYDGFFPAYRRAAVTG
jgi:serine/alanine adding enzyme